MVYGAINAKGEKYYTYMKKLFEAIGNRQTEFNWLITDCICYPDDPKTDAMLSKDYCWISGDELTEIVGQEDFQWIWGVLCAFDKSVALEDVMKSDLPRAEDYDGFWSRPISMQHPLARIEIVPWDSTMIMIFSDDKNIIDSFRAAYPFSVDFETYLDRM